ncbi:Solute carrier family 13 member 1 [Acipenser ruthenus]|uniref:Solute carrier family 13 member 1 n=1 Tax=Acipenser ruthenus TaxID=7906 RepID=A0A662YYN8_ACIRT|nr:Solute carrier family 13 member 1 [Acipenser ruthenus]
MFLFSFGQLKDLIMGKFTTNLKNRGIPFTAIYTAFSPSKAIVEFYSTVYVLCFGVSLKYDNPAEGINALELRFLMTNKFYKGSARKWFTIDSLEIIQDHLHTARFNASISAPAEYSYHCQLVGTNMNYASRFIPANKEAQAWEIHISDFQEAQCAYTLFVVAVYWLTEAIPLAVTALIPALMFPLFGIMKSKTVASAYFKDFHLLLIGVVCLATSIEKWNLHKRIALRMVMLVGVNPGWLMMGFMISSAFLSMWLSNTSTAAMVMPIVEAVIQQILNAEAEVNAIQMKNMDGTSNLGLQLDGYLSYTTLITWKEFQSCMPWEIALLVGGGFALAQGTEAEAIGVNPLYILIPTTLCTSFAFLLPVANPPNAIVFTYGHLQVIDMVKAGLGVNIIGVLAVMLGVRVWGVPLFDLETYPSWAPPHFSANITGP